MPHLECVCVCRPLLDNTGSDLTCLSCTFVLDTSVSISEIPEKFRNVVLGKSGEDLLDRSCEKWRSGAKNQ